VDVFVRVADCDLASLFKIGYSSVWNANKLQLAPTTQSQYITDFEIFQVLFPQGLRDEK